MYDKAAAPLSACLQSEKSQYFLLLWADLPSALQVLAVLIGFSCEGKKIEKLHSEEHWSK